MLYGCDSLVDGGETVFLQPKSVTFRFEFPSESVSPNTEASVPSAASVDLGPLVAQDGYTKSNVISVQIESAELRRRQPPNVNLNFIRDVEVFLQGPGGGAVSVATLGSPPAATSGNLQVTGGRDVATQVTGQNFSARLDFVPTNVLPDEDYELEVTLRLRIEVEG